MQTEIVAEGAPRGTGVYSQAIRAGDFVFRTTVAAEPKGILVESDAVLYLPR